MNKDYKLRVQSAIFKAVLDASMTEVDGKRTATIMAGEVVEVMLLNIAMLMATSEATDSPSKTRNLCNEFARKLQRYVVEAKRSDLSWLETVHLGEMQ